MMDWKKSQSMKLLIGKLVRGKSARRPEQFVLMRGRGAPIRENEAGSERTEGQMLTYMKTVISRVLNNKLIIE